MGFGSALAPGGWPFHGLECAVAVWLWLPGQMRSRLEIVSDARWALRGGHIRTSDTLPLSGSDDPLIGPGVDRSQDVSSKALSLCDRAAPFKRRWLALSLWTQRSARRLVIQRMDGAAKKGD